MMDLNKVAQPYTIKKLRSAADSAFAMLAGMQLDVFNTPSHAGPMTSDQIADALGVDSARLRLLLYSLVSRGLLSEEDEVFKHR
jgi:transcription initiation factor IIE alpha subunit